MTTRWWFASATAAFLASCALCAAGATVAGYQPGASAEVSRAEPLPRELADVGVTEHRDGRIPLDLTFQDENGREVRLGSYFDGRHPVILNPVYYSCPMLCGLVLDGVANAVKQMAWKPGQEYVIVTFSFDPRDKPALAKLKQEQYVREVGEPAVAAGWHFLSGGEPEIKALTDTIGFHYRWDEETQQFAHPTTLVICTPDARISRYLYGIEYPPQTVRLSLVEASQGKIGTAVDQITLFCFHYDPKQGRYALAATNLVRAGGTMTMVVLGAGLAALWRREKRRKKTT